MTSLVRRFLKTAILFLGIGLALGGWVNVLAGLTQIAGLLVFFTNMWSRIRGLGSLVREDAGERF